MLYALFFALLLAWGIGTPLQQSPDEWAHLYRAAGIYNGQVLISAPGPMDPVRGDPIRVPAWLQADRQAARCFLFRAVAPVSCGHPKSASDALVRTSTPAARYPPFYYAVVGWPLLLGHGNAVLYLMRIVAAALSAAFLAWGMLSLLRLGAGLAATGMVVAVTPMVAWLSTMINPNGMEIAAALSLWPSLILWCTTNEARLRRAGAIGAATAATVMVLSRSVSIIWVCVAVASVLPLVRLSWIRDQFKSRLLLKAPALVVLAGIVTLVWSGLSRQTQLGPLKLPGFEVRHDSLPHNVRLAYRYLVPWWRQSVGDFGWLDTPISFRLLHVYELAWVVLLLAAALAAVRRTGRFRALFSAGIAAALTVALTLILAASVANELRVGFWQGRYSVPMGVGVPLLLGYAAGRTSDRRVRWWAAGFSLLAGMIVSIVAVRSFLLFFHRNSVGIKHPWSLTGGWQPPGGIILWLAVLCLAMSGLALVAATAAAGPTATDSPDGSGANGSQAIPVALPT